MSTAYPALEVAKAIVAMGDTHQPRAFLSIAMAFGKIPAKERVEYRAEVVDCLMSLSADGQAKVEIGVLDRICKVSMPYFDKNRTTAVLMAAHARLGQASALAGLSDLIPVIALYAEN